MTIATDFRASGVSKAAMFVVALSAAALAGLALVGAMNGEFSGNFAFGMLLGSVGVMLATAISLRAPLATYRSVRAIWIAWSVLVLIVGLLFGASEGGSTVIAYSMAAQSFPVGLVVMPIAGNALSSLQPSLATVLLWAITTALGYVQWFVLLARIRPLGV